MIFGSGIAERYHERWFHAHLPTDRSVSFRTCGNELTGLSLAGPESKKLLQDLVDFDLDGFSFRDFTETWVGQVPVRLGRLTFTGDLGYEIWCAASYQQQLFDVILEHGRTYDLKLFGIRALDSMRLEKGWGSWATEYRPIYNPYEANMGWMVKLDKDFIGRDAAAKIDADGPTRKLVLFSVDVGTGDSVADCIGDEPIWHDNQVIGWVTSGGYAHHSDLSLAMGYVPIGIAGAQSGFEIEVVGQRRPARLLTEVPFDPSGARMRA
jgi:dimethylglycine dehydrogenase